VICVADSTGWEHGEPCPVCGHPGEFHPNVNVDIAGCKLCELVLFIESVRGFAADITDAVNEVRKAEGNDSDA
jgi:hypothetical protein